MSAATKLMEAYEQTPATVGELLQQYVALDQEAKTMEGLTTDIKVKRDLVKYRIQDQLTAMGTTSVTDKETKHRATAYEETRWVVYDANEFLAACMESPFLHELVVPSVNIPQAIEMAKADPVLFAEIPGIRLMSQPRLRITRGKG